MNPPTWPVVRGIPRSDGWDFGGFPYGLEPLTLPAHAVRESLDPDVREAPLPDGFDDACARLLAADPRAGRLECRDIPDRRTDVFWFRWITGHQVSFIIWQLMARALHEASASGGHAAGVPAALAHYVRACGGMLLYTGSCPREVYETAIRPSMYLQHRAFSGSWAPDYQPVRELFRGRLVPSLDPGNQAGLRRAIRTYHNIHGGIATKLVPHDRSLLQRSGVETLREDQRLLDTIYDNYFLTLRAPVPFADVVAQLLRRLNAIALDLAANGLSLGGTDPTAQLPAALLAAEVLDLERDLVGVNFALAKLAAGATGRGAGGWNGLDHRHGAARHTSAARG